MNNNSLGKLGESISCKFLNNQGYNILHRNFRFGALSEIDIIALKANSINFIEVKTRKDFEVNEHYKAINRYKVLKIKRGIAKFLAANPKFYGYGCQIIVLIVLINPYTQKPKVVFYNYLE